MPPSSLCGTIIHSRRGLLAFGWSIVTLLTFIAFLTALLVSTYSYQNDNNGDDGDDDNNDNEAKLSVTSHAMVFASFWMALLALGLCAFGTVILGCQSPTGQYLLCCPGAVFRTSPLSLGAFIGALLMFANLTLVTGVLFGEFHIRDYQWGGQDMDNEEDSNSAIERSSMAFSVMCMFLTVLYGGFAALVFVFHDAILSEFKADAREEALEPSPDAPMNLHPRVGGYVGGAYEPKTTGFISPPGSRNSVI